MNTDTIVDASYTNMMIEKRINRKRNGSLGLLKALYANKPDDFTPLDLDMSMYTDLTPSIVYHWSNSKLNRLNVIWETEEKT